MWYGFLELHTVSCWFCKEPRKTQLRKFVFRNVKSSKEEKREQMEKKKREESRAEQSRAERSGAEGRGGEGRGGQDRRGSIRFPRPSTSVDKKFLQRLLSTWLEFPIQPISIRKAQTWKIKAHIPLRTSWMCRPSGLILIQSCYFDSRINKPFTCSRCVICVSCSVHVISTFHARKGS